VLVLVPQAAAERTQQQRGGNIAGQLCRAARPGCRGLSPLVIHYSLYRTAAERISLTAPAGKPRICRSSAWWSSLERDRLILLPSIGATE